MQFQYLITFLFVLPIYALNILIPAYSYPINGAWRPIWNQVAAHPNVQFQIIINPDSGPGSTKYPESDYITALARLNKLPNVKTIGYVSTDYTNRKLADIIKDIDTYAGWASYTKANISVSGIFFDEATDSTSTAAKAYMKNISSHTYATFTSTKASVVFNPGCVVDKSYFAMADTIVEFEDALSQYKSQTTINTFQKNYMAKTAIIVHSSTASAASVKSMVQAAKTSKVGGIYFASDCCYNALNGTLLNQVASAMA